jgi:hypothetical protein
MNNAHSKRIYRFARVTPRAEKVFYRNDASFGMGRYLGDGTH